MSAPALGRRLLPLQAGAALQGMVLWVPVEKLFMTQIGFTAASVSVMAATYAAVVPLLEVPSGILADRWSRSWLMVVACVALIASSLLGGASTHVGMYIAAAMLLGIYFALSSGTVDSIVYDVVLEETGSSDLYETWIGRVRIAESAALVVSALAGGVVAGWTSARLTYFVTVPFIALAIIAFLRFNEPRLHRAAEPVALRRHVALMFTAITRQRNVRDVVLLAALVALLSQCVIEFGPLWLVSLKAPATVFGPYWAALVSTIGIGGYLAGKLDLERPAILIAFGVTATAATLVLSQSGSLAAVIVAQTVLALLLAIIAIHAGRVLHDGVPSSLRAGVSSGVGTFSWILFLPFSLVFGWWAREHGVQEAAWFITAAALGVALLLAASGQRRRPAVAEDPHEFACQDLVELATDFMDGVLPADRHAELQEHLAGCDGCMTYVEQLGLTARALRDAGFELPMHTHVTPA